MKLRNKKTGEIFDYRPTLQRWNGPIVARCNYNSLAELNEEWEDCEDEDVEEEFWYVDTDCETYGVSRAFNQNNSDDVLFNKSIGNYFETKEEAEQAVEKLKAWKRLKDKGFEFNGFELIEGKIRFVIDLRELEESDLYKDLILLFGKE